MERAVMRSAIMSMEGDRPVLSMMGDDRVKVEFELDPMGVALLSITMPSVVQAIKAKLEAEVARTEGQGD